MADVPDQKRAANVARSNELGPLVDDYERVRAAAARADGACTPETPRSRTSAGPRALTGATDQRLGDDHRGRDALALGLLLESVDGLRQASELAVDQMARASMTRHADDLMALLPAWPLRPSARPAHG